MNKLFVVGVILMSLSVVALEAKTKHAADTVLRTKDFSARGAFKFDVPPQCSEGQTRCVGKVYRRCVNGKFLNKELCHRGETCVDGRGCVITGLLAGARTQAPKQQKYLMEMGKSARRASRVASEQQVQTARKRWQVGGTVGRQYENRAGYSEALIPEPMEEK